MLSVSIMISKNVLMGMPTAPMACTELRNDLGLTRHCSVIDHALSRAFGLRRYPVSNTRGGGECETEVSACPDLSCRLPYFVFRKQVVS